MKELGPLGGGRMPGAPPGSANVNVDVILISESVISEIRINSVKICMFEVILISELMNS